MLRAVEIYWEAAPHFSPPAVPVEIPFDDTTLRPFLRLPRGVERPPCVVLIGGARSGRAVGLTLAGLAFGCFDWFFVPPYGTLAVDKPFGADFFDRVYSFYVFEHVLEGREPP